MSRRTRTTSPTASATGGIDYGSRNSPTLGLLLGGTGDFIGVGDVPQMNAPVIYSLTELIKRFELEQSDAEWAGDLRLATRCKKIATRYRERLEDGEEWEPSF